LPHLGTPPECSRPNRSERSTRCLGSSSTRTPRSLAPALRTAGLDACDVRDEGLRGQPDSRIFAFAVAKHFVIVTADVEFGNELVYPPRTHHGVVLVRLPESLPGPALVQMATTPIVMVSSEDLSGAIVVVEPGRVRIRRPTPA
jgi:predicted nuclease of predicted toxin-antitoxin system